MGATIHKFFHHSEKVSSGCSAISRKRAQPQRPASVTRPPRKQLKMTTARIEETTSSAGPGTPANASFEVYESPETPENHHSDSSDSGEEDCYVEGPNEDNSLRSIAESLDEDFGLEPVPPQLTDESTTGLGSPVKMWNLMVNTDKKSMSSSGYLDNHTDITGSTRAILIDWIMEVCESEKQHRETFHLAVDYVDRFLSNTTGWPVEHLQLIGMTAVFIASKFEEIYPPKLDAFIYYTDGACRCVEVQEMELFMLEKLDWILSPVTPVHWLSFFMQLLGRKEIKPDSEEGPSDKRCVVPNLMIEDFVHMAKILDLCRTDVRSLDFSYRELAAAVLFNCLEPQRLITQVTGINPTTITRAIGWVEPFVRYADRKRPLGDPIPQRSNVRVDDMHNIQGHGYYNRIETALAEIEEERKKLALESRPILRPAKRAILRSRLSF
ncbi:unnamed protein product, partial [Mesorhabditis spiculigera]